MKADVIASLALTFTGAQSVLRAAIAHARAESVPAASQDLAVARIGAAAIERAEMFDDLAPGVVRGQAPR